MDEDLKNIKEAKTLYAIWDNNKITAEKLTVHESFKADGAAEYTNDFIPTLETLKKQVKIMGADGKPQALADTDTFEILNDSNNAIAGDALKDYLYGKLQEKDNPKDEPTRIETVKAKITHKNGTSQTVDIPIKVIKNIYEAKTLTKKPYYVPADYVKTQRVKATTSLLSGRIWITAQKPNISFQKNRDINLKMRPRSQLNTFPT